MITKLISQTFNPVINEMNTLLKEYFEMKGKKQHNFMGYTELKTGTSHKKSKLMYPGFMYIYWFGSIKVLCRCIFILFILFYFFVPI